MQLDSAQNFIDGQWQPSLSGQTMPVFEPATGKAFGSIAESNAADVDLAVRAARHAFDEGPWGKTTPTDRGRMLSRLGILISQHAPELASLESRDTGKPKSAGAADIAALARYFEYYGGAADKLHGEVIPYLSGFQVCVLREPYGVTGHILPWNYPAQMFGRTLAPSLAARQRGCAQTC